MGLVKIKKKKKTKNTSENSKNKIVFVLAGIPSVEPK